LLAKALALLCLAALTRQNGAVVLPFAALAVGWIAARSGESRRRAFGYGLGFAVAAAVVCLAASAALATRLDGTPAIAEAWANLESYDIVAAAARDPPVQLHVFDVVRPAAARLVDGPGVATYSPERIDALEPVFDQLQAAGASRRLIALQWRDLILRDPLAYLGLRARAFYWVFATPQPDRCVVIDTGVDGAPADMAAAGLAPRKDARDLALAHYALGFKQTPVYRHWAYAAVAVALLVLLLRRRTAPDIAVAAMLASALAFAASFFIISIACDYRYLYALDLATIAAALYAAAASAFCSQVIDSRQVPRPRGERL
jgi:hypothetical protein